MMIDSEAGYSWMMIKYGNISCARDARLCILRTLGDVGHISTKATLFVEAIGSAAQVPLQSSLAGLCVDQNLS